MGGEAMSQPIYRIEGLQQVYDGRCVLSIDHLEVKQHEILSIVGPSGAGKSTLLRLLNFLESPTAGRLYYHDKPVTPDLSLEERRKVTTVFQQPLLLKRSVTANLYFGLNLRGRKLEEGSRDHWLERLGIALLAQQSASKLSAGEAQRVALARALIIRPEVLLLDEPTANLDPYNVSLIENIVQQENQQNKTTIVLVTHNIFQARRIAHRTALLLNGELVEVDDTDEFFNNPRHEETGAFVRGEYVY
jgi:tungstate transport system ATP-binding protein